MAFPKPWVKHSLEFSRFFSLLHQFTDWKKNTRWQVIQSNIQSLAGEPWDHTHTHQHTPKSIYEYENSYVQISITNNASYARKLSLQ